MINKNIKKSQGGTLTGIVLSVILVIGFFSGFFLFFQDQTDRGGVVLDSKYNDTFNRLESSRITLDDDVNEIQNNLKDIKEADDTFQVAWNGLKGLGNVLTLPISFISSAVDVLGAVLIPLDVIPNWAKDLIVLALIAVTVLIVLANLKGEPKT